MARHGVANWTIIVVTAVIDVSMKKSRSKSNVMSAESIARLAKRGKEERLYFHPFHDLDDMTRLTLQRSKPKSTKKKT